MSANIPKLRVPLYAITEIHNIFYFYLIEAVPAYTNRYISQNHCMFSFNMYIEKKHMYV